VPGKQPHGVVWVLVVCRFILIAARELGAEFAGGALWSLGLRRDPGATSLRGVEMFAGLIIFGLFLAWAVASLLYMFSAGLGP